MKNRFVILTMLLLTVIISRGQTFHQYFDGADTTNWSLKIKIDTSANNVWQIGKPQKSIFDSAATLPNAILTDTLNSTPTNNISSFSYSLIPENFGYGILAIQWKQKLDMESGKEGGKIELSVDSGKTWSSPFNNPYTYNFYGFDSNNVSSLPNGDTVFTGTDSSWRDVWLCYDISWLRSYDSIIIKHTYKSDSVNYGKEGWMIDNILQHITLVHTVNEEEQTEYMKVHPNPTTGRVNIETQKQDEFHLIEDMKLVNSQGQVVQSWKNIPTKFFIDIGHHKNGIYYLKAKTNIQTVTHKIILDN